MVSTMESDELRDAQLLAERAEVAPWLDYPASPWWYAPAGGAWFGALVAASADGGEQRSPAFTFVLFALAAGFFWWARRRWGTWPRMSSMPPEFHRPATTFAVAVVILFIGGMGLAASAGDIVAVPLVAVTVAALLRWYDHAYAEASERAAVRLGTTSRAR